MVDDQQEPNIEDTLTRSQLEVIKSRTARAADKPLLDYADQMTERLRALRESNHWAKRIRDDWQSTYEGKRNA